MVAINTNWRHPAALPDRLSPAGLLADRVRRYFARHPEVSREDFLRDAVARELTLGEGPGAAADRPRLTAEDVRIHARLNERLAALHYERYGLWPRIRRFLRGTWLVRRPVS